MSDETLYNLDVNKYSYCHHINRKTTYFFAEIYPKNNVIEKMLNSYKYFYDEEIKKIVDTYYKQYIEHYGYLFDDYLK